MRKIIFLCMLPAVSLMASYLHKGDQLFDIGRYEQAYEFYTKCMMSKSYDDDARLTAFINRTMCEYYLGWEGAWRLDFFLIENMVKSRYNVRNEIEMFDFLRETMYFDLIDKIKKDHEEFN